MKRILTILVSIAVMLSLAVVPVAAADDSATTVTVETLSNEVKAGDTVTLAVTIANNPGFTDFQWIIEYDKSKLEIESIETSRIIDFEGEEIVSDYISGALVEANPNYDDGKAFITCAKTTAFTKDNTTLFKLVFEVKGTADAGFAEVKIVSDRFASVGEFINANYISGGVTVVHVCGNGTLVPAVEATCTDPSVDAYYVCSCKKAYEDEACQKEITDLDDWKIKNNDALGHTEGEAVIENKVSGDCENGGSYDSVVYCTVCDEELSRDTFTTEALGHDYKGVITAPTETKEGYTTYTCSVCGDSYIDDIVPATGTTGDSTTGDSTTGDSTTGDSTTGDSTTGDSTTGDSTTGDSTTGDSTTGDSTTGDSTTGDSTTGDSTAGDSTTGDSTTGDSTTGDSTTGDSTTGDSTTGDSTTGDSTTGDSTTGDSTTGDSTTGDSTTGDSTTGDSTTGDSTTGDSTTGDSTTGDSTTGDSTTGDISVVDKSDNDTSDDVDGATWLFRIEGDSIIMTVEHELACVVIIQTDDETFVPVKAIENDDGSYDFDISEMMAGSDVIIAVKGDYDLDGEITMYDASFVMNAWVNNTEIDDITRIVSDVDNSDELDMNDASNIMNAWVNDTRFSW